VPQKTRKYFSDGMGVEDGESEVDKSGSNTVT